MTNPNTPSEEQLDNIDPNRDRAVDRENDEGIEIEVRTVTSNSVSETDARTYTRAFGHYFVNEDSVATETIDEIFAEITSEQSVLDTFQRRVGESYEVTVALDDTIKSTDYTFSRSNAATIQIPSHSPYAEKVDNFLDQIEEEV